MRTGVLVSLLLMSHWVSADSAGSAFQVPLFKAKYGLYALGIQFAEAERSLSKTPDGAYLFHTLAKAVGVLAVFRNDRIEESSLWRLTADVMQPIKYQYHHTGSKKQQHKLIDFNWETLTAVSTENDKQWNLVLKPGTLDMLLSQMALTRDLMRGERGDRTYLIADEDGIKPYTLQYAGEAVIDTDLGYLKTLKFIRRAKNPQRYSMLWCAVDYQFLPVRIEHTEPGGDTVTTKIISLDGIQHRP